MLPPIFPFLQHEEKEAARYNMKQRTGLGIFWTIKKAQCWSAIDHSDSSFSWFRLGNWTAFSYFSDFIPDWQEEQV